MFMTLAVRGGEESRWQRWKRSVAGRGLWWQSASCGGCRYIRVEWYGAVERIPWNRIAMLTDRRRLPVLIPPEITLPEGCPIRRYEPQDFTAKLVVATARQCLAQVPEKARRGLVGVIDPQGIAPWVCSELAPTCRGLKIYTLRPQRYALQEKLLEEEYGLPLLYAASTAEMKECLLCVAPYPTGILVVPAPTLTADRSGIQGRPTVNRLAMALSAEQRAAVPPGVIPTAFWGALTEQGMRRIGLDLRAEGCRIDGRLAPPEELARLM